ncbi:hypothetical protein MLD38_015205 [Melastoma candidum]|uniref:Uncharacterized protein n=1 Tax=Melastoma candidum TaxID=119954 RepID=A0ACB9RFE0_9MYRT|nr:hypothetical protein MLD38_015205 [Melastoma candidum]
MVAARDVGCELFKSGESRGATSSSGKLVTAAVKSETAGGRWPATMKLGDAGERGRAETFWSSGGRPSSEGIRG